MFRSQCSRILILASKVRIIVLILIFEIRLMVSDRYMPSELGRPLKHQAAILTAIELAVVVLVVDVSDEGVEVDLLPAANVTPKQPVGVQGQAALRGHVDAVHDDGKRLHLLLFERGVSVNHLGGRLVEVFLFFFRLRFDDIIFQTRMFQRILFLLLLLLLVFCCC